MVTGGYPPALARKAEARRSAWYRSYLDSIVQRDVRDMSRIASFDVLPRLLEMAAAQTARLFNAAAIAAPFQLSRPTIRDYLALLERVFLIELLPPWHSNRISRLVKSPKSLLRRLSVEVHMLWREGQQGGQRRGRREPEGQLGAKVWAWGQHGSDRRRVAPPVQ